MSDTEKQSRYRGLKPFAKGQSGNPLGKAAGVRDLLGRRFLELLHKDFQENGADTISRLRLEDPAAYCKLIAGLLPQHLLMEHTPGESIIELLAFASGKITLEDVFGPPPEVDITPDDESGGSTPAPGSLPAPGQELPRGS